MVIALPMDSPPDMILGEPAISAYVGVTRKTLWNWRTKYGLPTFRAPDGRLAMLRNDFINWCHARMAVQEATGRSRLRPPEFKIAEYLDRKATA